MLLYDDSNRSIGKTILDHLMKLNAVFCGFFLFSKSEKNLLKTP